MPRPVVIKVVPTPGPSTPVATKDNPFPNYADKSRGWHFKEPIPEDLPPPDEEPPAPPPPPPSKSEPPGPKALSAAWLRENMPKYLDAAIENPSSQNISNYLYLQKYAMDMSERFAGQYRRVVFTDPNLDESASNPTWTGGSQAMAAYAENSKKDLIRSMNKSFAIWFFFRSDCQPCHIQAPVLESFARTYGFSVLPISLDGAPMVNSPFKRYVVDAGQAAKLGVDGTPTILLVKPPNVAVPVSYGMSSIPELETRVVEAAAQLGVITDKQYADTRPERKRPIPSSVDVTPGMAKIDASDPNAVRDYLKSLVKSK